MSLLIYFTKMKGDFFDEMRGSYMNVKGHEYKPEEWKCKV